MKDYTKGKSPEMLEPFFPNELFRHIIVLCFLVIIELVAVIFFPLPKLVKKPDHIPWPLLPVYNLKQLIQNETPFISILVLCALLFVFWPFLIRERRYTVSSFNNTEGTNSGYARYVKERCNLWQRPIPFMIVITAIIFVVTLCFINP